MARGGQQCGDIRADIGAELAGHLLFDAYAGVVLRWAAPDDAPFPLRKALRDTRAIIVGGLRAWVLAGVCGHLIRRDADRSLNRIDLGEPPDHTMTRRVASR